MDQVTQQNAAMVEESTAASHSLSQEAMGLAESVARFNLGAPAPITRKAPVTTPARQAQRPVVQMRNTWSGSAAVRSPEPVAEDAGWEEF